MNFLRELLRSIIAEIVRVWWADRKRPKDVTVVGANKNRQEKIKAEIEKHR